MKTLLAHLLIDLSAMLMTFCALDGVNPAMAFLDNTITLYLIAILCGTLTCAVVRLWLDGRKK